MRDAAFAGARSLSHEAAQAVQAWAKKDPEEMGVRIDIVLRSPRRVKRDRDNVIAGLKWAFDGLAQGTGVDDSVFHLGEVSFEKGAEETVLILRQWRKIADNKGG